MELNEIAGLLALTELDGVGDKRAIELYNSLGGVDNIIESHISEFDNLHYVDEGMHEKLSSLSDIVSEKVQMLEEYTDRGVSILGVNDEDYPQVLRDYNSPPVLYLRGDKNLLKETSVSFTGSRDTNVRGKTWAREVASEVANSGYVVVSGGAFGTDTAAHRGALEGSGKTIVVMGTGVLNPYPDENSKLFERVVDEGGLLVSHRPPEAEPNRTCFLDRNGTISALSPCIIVVATDGSGGTMSQYQTALGQNKEILVPSEEISDIQPSRGIRKIRKEEKSGTIVSADDILDLFAESESEETEKGFSNGEVNQSSLDDW